MKNVYKLALIIALCVVLILVISIEVAVYNLVGEIWRTATLFTLSVTLVLDLYLLWRALVNKSVFHTNTFYLLVLATVSFLPIPFLLQLIQPMELLLWLLLGLLYLWQLAAILILGGSSFEKNCLFPQLVHRIQPANLLLMCFSFSLFAPIFYELYSRFDYEIRRDHAISAALKHSNVRFDLYAELFKSIDEPLLKFTHNPNVSILFQDPETDYYQMSVRTNSFGFRDVEFQPEDIAADDFVVLFAGDSVTFGVGVEAEQTFVEQSELLIADFFKWQESDAEVWHINLGVGSYGLIEVVESLKSVEALHLKPDVIVYSYNINDYSAQVRGLDQETGALVPFKPRSFFLWNLRQMLRPQSVDVVLSQKLDELVEISNELGADLVINILPAEPNPKAYPSTFEYDSLFLQSYQFIHEYIAENKIAFVDGLAIFQEESEHEYLFVRPSYQDDGNHYNALGHQLMGTLVAISLLDIIATESSSALLLEPSLENWGDWLLENSQFAKARAVYTLLLQIQKDTGSVPSKSLLEKLDMTIEENLFEDLDVYIDFSSSNVSAFLDNKSKIPPNWEWRIVPECSNDDCSGLSCLETSCFLKNDDLGLLVSEKSEHYQNFPSISIDGSSGTVAFWFRPETASTAGPPARLLWSYWLDLNNRAYINLSKDEGLQVVFKTAIWQIVSAPINWQANEWHHVAMVWDAEFPTVKLYIDGQLAAYSFTELELPSGNGREAFGSFAYDGSLRANGYFGEFVIFPDMLTALDIEWLYRKNAAYYID